MEQIRLHGRGGQGTVLASVLLAKALFKCGFEVQSFPAFGVERRGAPVTAYLKIDRARILDRTTVSQPDHVLVQDIQLLSTAPVIQGLKENGWVLLNTADAGPHRATLGSYRVAYVDAGRIAWQHRLGTKTQPVTNTAMIGAFARLVQKPSLTALSDAIRGEIRFKPEENVSAAKTAYQQVQFC